MSEIVDKLHLIDQQLIESIQQLNHFILALNAPLHNPEHALNVIPMTKQLLDTIEQLRLQYDHVMGEIEGKDIKLEENEVPIMKPLNPINFD